MKPKQSWAEQHGIWLWVSLPVLGRATWKVTGASRLLGEDEPGPFLYRKV